MAIESVAIRSIGLTPFAQVEISCSCGEEFVLPENIEATGFATCPRCGTRYGIDDVKKFFPDAGKGIYVLSSDMWRVVE